MDRWMPPSMSALFATAFLLTATAAGGWASVAASQGSVPLLAQQWLSPPGQGSMPLYGIPPGAPPPPAPGGPQSPLERRQTEPPILPTPDRESLRPSVGRADLSPPPRQDAGWSSVAGQPAGSSRRPPLSEDSLDFYRSLFQTAASIGAIAVLGASSTLITGMALFNRRRRRTLLQHGASPNGAKTSGAQDNADGGKEAVRKRVEDELLKQAKQDGCNRQERSRKSKIDAAWSRDQRMRLEQSGKGQSAAQHNKRHSGRNASQSRARSPQVYDKNWAYSILGVSSTTSPNDVKKAYIASIKNNHPDQAGPENGTVAATLLEKTKLINIAYDILKKQR